MQQHIQFSTYTTCTHTLPFVHTLVFAFICEFHLTNSRYDKPLHSIGLPLSCRLGKITQLLFDSTFWNCWVFRWIEYPLPGPSQQRWCTRSDMFYIWHVWSLLGFCCQPSQLQQPKLQVKVTLTTVYEEVNSSWLWSLVRVAIFLLFVFHFRPTRELRWDLGFDPQENLG